MVINDLSRIRDYLRYDEKMFPLQDQTYAKSDECFNYLEGLFGKYDPQNDAFTITLQAYGPGLVCAFGHIFDQLMKPIPAVQRDHMHHWLTVLTEAVQRVVY
jgi:hypothetical protein